MHAISKSLIILKRKRSGGYGGFVPTGGRLLLFETCPRSNSDYVRSQPLNHKQRYLGEITNLPSFKRMGRPPIVHIVARGRETPERAPLEVAICSNFSAESLIPHMYRISFCEMAELRHFYFAWGRVFAPPAYDFGLQAEIYIERATRCFFFIAIIWAIKIQIMGESVNF